MSAENGLPDSLEVALVTAQDVFNLKQETNITGSFSETGIFVKNLKIPVITIYSTFLHKYNLN